MAGYAEVGLLSLGWAAYWNYVKKLGEESDVRRDISHAWDALVSPACSYGRLLMEADRWRGLGYVKKTAAQIQRRDEEHRTRREEGSPLAFPDRAL